MYTLKSIAQRGSMLGAAVALVAAAVIPSAAVFADSLNPLTDRSLLLSSSAPGYTDTDGSGNSVGGPNAVGENYAPAGSGPNGKKSGETFTFKVNTDNSDAGNTVKAFTLQYCTKAAGKCQAPGDNGKAVTGYDAGDPDPVSTEGDARNGVYDESTNATGRPTNAQAHPKSYSDLNINFADDGSGGDPGSGLVGGTDYVIRVNGTPLGSYSGWNVTTENVEDSAFLGPLTGKQNYITLSNATGLDLNSQDKVEIIFKASETNYITNPGSGSFFVKINTYDTDNDALWTNTVPENNPNIIDGGVTVANVMTDSIHITTKVLETMSFSVGTQNRDTVAGAHGTCDAIQVTNGNRLNLGDVNAEYSLDTNVAYDVNSYWRLSSNSSGGATVYYSGNTLANTVGDEIADMPSEEVSNPGTEQFGLGFIDAGLDTFDAAFSNGSNGLVETQPTRYKIPRSFPFKTLDTQTTGDYASLASQPKSTGYDEATGRINTVGVDAPDAKFKFLKSSLTVPEPIAEQNEQVISCATAKMRYVANIGADTPAGVYTTKINYLAAPQY